MPIPLLDNVTADTGLPTITESVLHAGTYWYILFFDASSRNITERYVRLYMYRPNRPQAEIIFNPKLIKQALEAAKRHDMHECDPHFPCDSPLQAKPEEVTYYVRAGYHEPDTDFEPTPEETNCEYEDDLMLERETR